MFQLNLKEIRRKRQQQRQRRQKKGKGGSRTKFRKKEKAEKEAARDFERGSGQHARGLALGVANQKDIAIIAQTQVKLSNARYEGELIKLTNLLNSKTDQVQSAIKMATLYHQIGNADKAAERMEIVERLENEASFTETELYNLKNTGPSSSVEVDTFLKRGRESMGIDTEDGKKKKSDNVSIEEGKEEE